MESKGDAKKAIIKALKEEGPISIKGLLKLGKLKRSTVYDNLRKLKANKDIDEIGGGMFIYIDKQKQKQKIADPEKIKLTIKRIKNKSSEIRENGIKDLIAFTDRKKIMDLNILKYIIKFFKEEPDESLRFKFCRIIEHNLHRYMRDRDPDDNKMIDILNDKKNITLFIKVAENNSETPRMREIALSILIWLGEEKRIDIAFKILNEEIRECDYNEINVRGIILRYAKRTEEEIRSRLYDLLDNGSEIGKERARDLLAQIRYM